MSYTRRFSKDITVHYSGSVSYGPSQSGGSKHYSGTVTETVYFDVHVDTDPFDEEVHKMKDHVDLLTGSVVATEAAHVASIDETSRQVGDTIISGFFKTVKSDISQQITELKTRSEALLMQLNKLAGQCNEKKRQMGVDYQRLAERYSKIFTDLNNELENRIYSIDEPVFHVTRSLNSVGNLNSGSDMIAVASVSSGETSRVHSMIAANLAKKEAVKAIDKGKKYLSVQYATDRVLDKCLLPEAKGATLSSPYCFIETTNADGTVSRQVYGSPLLGNIDTDSLEGKLNDLLNGRLSENEVRAIGEYFNTSIARELNDSKSSHDKRVAEMTAKLFDLSNTDAPGK